MLAMVAAVAMIAAQVLSKATRDAFFLSNFPATSLPTVMAGSAALSIVVVLLVSRLMTRLTPARVVPAVFAVNGLLFVAEWALSTPYPRVAAVAVYLHTSSLGATAISSFWSVVNERFDPHTAKRVIGRVAGGAALGGVVGGIASWQLAGLMALPNLLLVLGGTTGVAALTIARIGGPPPRADEPRDGESPSGIAVLGQVSYLRQLALLIVLIAIGESAIDYVFKASAAANYTTGSTLVTFFAIFHMAAAVAAFALQTTVAKRALATLGLAGTVALLPGIVVFGSVIGLLFPALWSAVALRGGAAVAENSFYRSGYELLYTPLAPAQKRPTKTVIDVGVARLGMAAGAGLVMLFLAIAPERADTVLIVVALAASLSALAVASFLHTGYVEALADSLRSGFVKLDESDVIDRTTHRTLSQTTMALDRDKLLREIAAMRMGTAEPADKPDDGSEREDEILRAVAELRSGDEDRVRRCLRDQDEIDPLLVPFVIPLVANSRLLRDVVPTLRKVANQVTGQLVDALLLADSPAAIRRRIPRVLSTCLNQRAADGLVLGLDDDLFEVRDWCGVALLSITEKAPDIAIARKTIFAAARREAELDAASTAIRGNRHLEHTFRILSLTLEREPLQLAFRALGLDDEILRGTALEYLDNVLPADLHELLAPQLGRRKSPTRRPRPARPRAEIVEELLTTMNIPRDRLG